MISFCLECYFSNLTKFGFNKLIKNLKSIFIVEQILRKKIVGVFKKGG